MTPEERLSDARIYLGEHAIYFMDAILNLIPYETKEIETYAVTPNMVMLYNPDYVMALSDKQNATRMWHEIQHVLRDSWDRLVDVDPDINNTCSDLAINSSGLDGPWDFGPDGLLPSRYGMPDGLTMEEYHDLLPKHPQASAEARQNHKCGAGKCGGIAGNPAHPNLEAQLVGIGRSQSDIQLVKRQTARNILDHAKSAGKLPGGWTEWAEAILAPAKIRWGTHLSSLYRDSYSKISAGRDEYTLSRISKRTYMFPGGAIRPSMIKYDVEVALVLDTSGSMDIDGEIRPALREARDIIMQSGNEKLWFLQIDAAEACKPKRVGTVELLKLEIAGRGGTDFRPAFLEAPKLRPQPRLLIYFTDGIGPAPERAPKGMEVIWCLMGKQRQVPAKWGRVVNVED